MSLPDNLKDTDRCVMCGLCLPHCPTYGITRDEGDSPRGRLALMQGLDRGALAVNERLLGHLDRCLECRACEAMCPSEVPFGRLMDAARARVEPQRPRSGFARLRQRLIRRILLHPRHLRILASLLRLYQRGGLQWLARRSGLLRITGLRELDKRLPLLQTPLPLRPHAPAAPAVGTIALFTGCVGSVTDTESQRAAVRLLTALGYEVRIPRDQACCGALLQHGGDPEGARRLASTNLDIFASDLDAVIATASGCSAHLAEYGALYGPAAAGWSERFRDITAFLAAADWSRIAAFRALPETVAVHDACTLRHALKQHQSVYRLLERIPELKTVHLNPAGTCCGAAGAYMLTQAAMAATVRQPHIERLKTLGVRTLVSTNIGCALHLAAGIREAGLDIEVVHPVTLLARQLDT